MSVLSEVSHDGSWSRYSAASVYGELGVVDSDHGWADLRSLAISAFLS